MSRLLSWDPDKTGTNGQAMVGQAHSMQRAAGVPVGVKAAFVESWVGEAGDAAIAHTDRRIAELEALAEVAYSAGTTLVGAGAEFAWAQTALRRALESAAAAGCVVADDGTVSPPALPAVPSGLAGAEVVAWVGQAERAAGAVAAGWAQQVAAALDAAAATDEVGAAALAKLEVPAISAPAKPVLLTVVNGQLRAIPVEAPDLPDPQPPPAPPADREPEEERGFWGNLVGGVGSGAWKSGPGLIGDVVGWVPLTAADEFDDAVDRAYEDLSEGYGADTSSDAYRTADISTQVAGFFATGGVGAVRAVPAAAKAVPAAIRAAPAASRALAGAAREAGSLFASLPEALSQIRPILIATPDGWAVPAGIDASSLGAWLAKAKELTPALQRSKQRLGGRAPSNGAEFAGKVFTPKDPVLQAKYPDGVRFTDDGFPDFTPYVHTEVVIAKLTGNRVKDYAAANAAAKLEHTPDDFIWHHHQDVPKMQLVPADIHTAVAHSGGFAIDKAAQPVLQKP